MLPLLRVCVVFHLQFVHLLTVSPGSLRWNAPAAPATVSGVQQAVDQPPRCLQSYPGFTSTNPYAPINKKRAAADTEDCLYLKYLFYFLISALAHLDYSVYVPGALGSKTNLPVVVWIHGGGYAHFQYILQISD